MAARRDRKLLEAARKCAKQLGSAATWAVSGKAVSVRDDFVYETYVFLRLLIALKRTYRLEYIEGSGNSKHAFPKSPARKAGRPRFNLVDRGTKKVLWQLCAGTKIGDISGDERAPDISLQNASASDSPQASDVELIWAPKLQAAGGPHRKSRVLGVCAVDSALSAEYQDSSETEPAHADWNGWTLLGHERGMLYGEGR